MIHLYPFQRPCSEWLVEKTKDVALDSTEKEGVKISYLLDVQLSGRASRNEVVQPNSP